MKRGFAAVGKKQDGSCLQRTMSSPGYPETNLQTQISASKLASRAPTTLASGLGASCDCLQSARSRAPRQPWPLAVFHKMPVAGTRLALVLRAQNGGNLLMQT